MDIQLDKGLQLDEDQLKKALRLIGKEFIKEARLLLNQPDLSPDNSLPHTETGTLARSLKASVRQQRGVIWLRIIADTRYATALFSGSTRENKEGVMVQVRGRPLFEIVMDRLKPRMQQIISDSLVLKSGVNR